MSYDRRRWHVDALLDLVEYQSKFRPQNDAAYSREQMDKALNAILMMYEARTQDTALIYAQAGLMNALGIDFWNSSFKRLSDGS
jgi:hypothetical protein